MKSCCVLDCSVDSDNDAIFFEFPTSRTLRRKWLDAIQITGKLAPDSTVCSEHFPKSDYEVVRGKVRLKRKVVPSVFNRDEAKKIKSDDIEARINVDHNIPSDVQEVQDENTQTPTEVPTTRVLDSEVNESQSANSELDIGSKLNGSSDSLSVNNQVKFCAELNGQGRSISNLTRSNRTPSIEPESITNEGIQLNIPIDPDPREDIEEMITNYQIKNKPNKLVDPTHPVPVTEEPVHDAKVVESKPVFIEVTVGQDGRTSDVNTSNKDCLMVLERVQVDVDPSSLMLPERNQESDDDDVFEVTKKDDPISLLTSSDDDEVIIEEPHIDIVEVSDEDEDDVPLVQLAGHSEKYTKLAKIMWGHYTFYCLQCKFSTTNQSDYNKHLKVHETVLQMCQICNYTTSSKSQFTRHKRKHIEEKRFKCQVCNFRSSYQMSLVYHLRTHGSEKKKFSCDVCDYGTNRRSDLRRHQNRIHGADIDL